MKKPMINTISGIAAIINAILFVGVIFMVAILIFEDFTSMINGNANLDRLHDIEEILYILVVTASISLVLHIAGIVMSKKALFQVKGHVIGLVGALFFLFLGTIFYITVSILFGWAIAILMIYASIFNFKAESIYEEESC